MSHYPFPSNGTVATAQSNQLQLGSANHNDIRHHQVHNDNRILIKIYNYMQRRFGDKKQIKATPKPPSPAPAPKTVRYHNTSLPPSADRSARPKLTLGPELPHMLILITNRRHILRPIILSTLGERLDMRGEDNTQVVDIVEERRIVPVKGCVVLARRADEHGTYKNIHVLGGPVGREVDAEVVSLHALRQHADRPRYRRPRRP
jgi:hypothetical protein